LDEDFSIVKRVMASKALLDTAALTTALKICIFMFDPFCSSLFTLADVLAYAAAHREAMWTLKRSACYSRSAKLLRRCEESEGGEHPNAAGAARTD
jgi:hypothetical protein